MTDSANAAGGVPAGTTYNLVFVPGDGIGPEVIAAGRRVLEATGRIYGFGFDWRECDGRIYLTNNAPERAAA